MSQLELIATAAFGLEAVVSRELKQLGYANTKTRDGRITFPADVNAVCRCNLWLRSADRVLLKLTSFDADDFGALFDQVNAIPWEEWLPIDAKFPVRAKSVRSQLHSEPDIQGLVKKAIVERLKKTYRRNWFDETGALFPVDVLVLKDEITISIDTSGDGLHKRGYRTLTSQAPLRETLAAALVQLSYWNRTRPFIDPLCGSGTIVVEAALIARNMAPGMNRTFTAQEWPCIPTAAWDAAREEASSLVADKPDFTLIGYDQDDKVLNLARYHAKQAGVFDDVYFQPQEFSQLSTKRKYGCLITNPPYGERLGEAHDVEKLYRQMATVFRDLDHWSIYVLTSHPEFERLVGQKADRRRKLYNARIACTYHQYLGPPPPRSES
ncbi:MAG: RNA methyltransferase [Planctomycetaceae bacterium]|nr:RNA methyltransferase [Planctomycetaceae bacterium]